MFTLLNWYTALPPALGLTFFVSTTIVLPLLPWGVARWRDRHGALPRRRRAGLWPALLGAAGALVVGLFLIAAIVGMIVWVWIQSGSFQGHEHTWPPPDDMAAGLVLSIVIPLDCLVSAMVYRAIRWKRIEAAEHHVAPA